MYEFIFSESVEFYKIKFIRMLFYIYAYLKNIFKIITSKIYFQTKLIFTQIVIFVSNL